MARSGLLSRYWRQLIFFALALPLITLDQLSKLWIRTNLALNETLFKIGFFRVIYIRNTGAAFGIFRGSVIPLLIFQSLASVLMLSYVFKLYHRFPLLDRRPIWVALGLIFAGTVGNLLDRALRGYVTDFLDTTYWPAFNVADSCIVVGVAVLVGAVIYLIRESESGHA